MPCAHAVHEGQPSTRSPCRRKRGPHFQEALLHAELSRERCAELVFSLGFMMMNAAMIILLVFLFVFGSGCFSVPPQPLHVPVCISYAC